MKPVTKGRHLWTRTIGSTVVGQAVDTATVMILVFGGTLPVLDRQPDRLRVLAKVLYEAAATPLTYTVVNYLNRKERVDVFDYNSNFNPFVG